MVHVVNTRVTIGKRRGTIRWVGHLAASDREGEWLGIDWDDLLAGKHDGRGPDQQRYFTATGPTSGSFVYASKVPELLDLEGALNSRYGSLPLSRTHLSVAHEALGGFGAFAPCSPSLVSALATVTHLDVSDTMIASTSQLALLIGSCIQASCPLQELMAGQLAFTGEEVKEREKESNSDTGIVNAVAVADTSVLPPIEKRTMPQLLSAQLRVLSLHGCYLPRSSNWSQLLLGINDGAFPTHSHSHASATPQWPLLELLQLQDIRGSAWLLPLPVSANKVAQHFPALQSLLMGGEELEMPLDVIMQWSLCPQLKSLSAKHLGLHSLQGLDVDECESTSTSSLAVWPQLERLSLVGNEKLCEWKELNALIALPHLQHLNLLGTYLGDHDIRQCRRECAGRLSRLISLNNVIIRRRDTEAIGRERIEHLGRERELLEQEYLQMTIAAHWLQATCLDDLPAVWNDQPLEETYPRLRELIEMYGWPGLLAPPVVESKLLFKSVQCSIHFACDHLRDPHTTDMAIPTEMPLRQVGQLLVQKMRLAGRNPPSNEHCTSVVVTVAVKKLQNGEEEEELITRKFHPDKAADMAGVCDGAKVQFMYRVG